MKYVTMATELSEGQIFYQKTHKMRHFQILLYPNSKSEYE